LTLGEMIPFLDIVTSVNALKPNIVDIAFSVSSDGSNRESSDR